MSEIRVVVIEPGRPAYTTFIGKELKDMQYVVGGYIEVLPASVVAGAESLLEDKFLLVVNEEGKIDDLKLNFPILEGKDWILGTAFICRADVDEMVGLSEDEAKTVMQVFNNATDTKRRDLPAAPGQASPKTIYVEFNKRDSGCQGEGQK